MRRSGRKGRRPSHNERRRGRQRGAPPLTDRTDPRPRAVSTPLAPPRADSTRLFDNLCGLAKEEVEASRRRRGAIVGQIRLVRLLLQQRGVTYRSLAEAIVTALGQPVTERAMNRWEWRLRQRTCRSFHRRTITTTEVISEDADPGGTS